MYFGTKSYLKSNHYHTPKHPLSQSTSRFDKYGFISEIEKAQTVDVSSPKTSN